MIHPEPVSDVSRTGENIVVKLQCPKCQSRLDVLETTSGGRIVAVSLLGDAVEHSAAALETFQAAGPTLTCPITAFGGSHDSEVSDWQLREWRQHTSAAFVTKVLPGGHFFLHTAGRALLEEIACQLS